MARFNWSRPAGGRELEAHSYRRVLPSARPQHRDTSAAQLWREHQTHQASVKPGDRGWMIWCEECECRIRYLTPEQIRAWLDQ
jgi:hypothetical protein